MAFAGRGWKEAGCNGHQSAIFFVALGRTLQIHMGIS
jgi:hypothetical protein